VATTAACVVAEAGDAAVETAVVERAAAARRDVAVVTAVLTAALTAVLTAVVSAVMMVVSLVASLVASPVAASLAAAATATEAAAREVGASAAARAAAKAEMVDKTAVAGKASSPRTQRSGTCLRLCNGSRTIPHRS
jgi:hypothetical protein